MLTNSSKYALKAVLFLALNSNEEKKVRVKEIAGLINVPQPYTAKLLQKLSKKNIISSTRGPKGGFYLDNKNIKQTILDIVYAIDGEKNLNSCLLSLKKCNESKPCPLHKLANPSRSEFLNILKHKSISDLSMEVQNGSFHLPL